MKTQRTVVYGYAVAIVAVLVAALLAAAFRRPVEGSALLPFLLPVMLAAGVGGLGPGLVATGLAAAALLVPPLGAGEGSLLPVAWFVAVGAVASGLIGARRSPGRATASSEARGAVEEALHRSEERYRAIVETQSEMVCRFRTDGEILFVNGGYARARGTTPEALTGRSFWQFIADEDRPAVQSMLDCLTPESPEVRIENRFETAEGVRWTLWTNRALAFDEAGRCIEAQSTGIDITDRKEAEEALLEASRRKTEFLAVLGHELRNPLAPLSAGVELLRRGRAPDSIDEVGAMMKRQLDHLTRLVEDLLDLSRISRGEIALRKIPLDLRQVVHSAIELTRPLIAERNHRLTIDVPPGPVTIDGDFQRLTQIVANLLSNAAKYTDAGGAIEIVVEAADGQGVIRVRDSGFGFPPENLDTLFEMFTQVPEHRERTGGGGLGIGLALSRQLTEQHGGTIRATSEGLGRGSEFTVRLPLCESEPVAVPMPEAAGIRVPEHAESAARKILIVDDNVDAAESLGLVLELEGHAVRIAHDAGNGIEMVRTFDPDIVLLDIGLPEIDGYEAARRIRALPRGSEKLLIAITGWGQAADRERALEGGFDEHLPKPVDWDALSALIDADARAAGGRAARHS